MKTSNPRFEKDGSITVSTHDFHLIAGGGRRSLTVLLPENENRWPTFVRGDTTRVAIAHFLQPEGAAPGKERSLKVQADEGEDGPISIRLQGFQTRDLEWTKDEDMADEGYPNVPAATFIQRVKKQAGGFRKKWVVCRIHFVVERSVK